MTLGATALTVTGKRKTRLNSEIINAVGDYSENPIEFSFISNEENNSENLEVGTLTAYIEGVGFFAPDEYGGMPELTNGVEIFVEQKGERIEITHGIPIKSNAMWGIHANVALQQNFAQPGVGTEAFLAKLDFTRFSKSKALMFTPIDKVIVRLNDDFTGLTRHMFNLQGYQFAPGEKQKG